MAKTLALAVPTAALIAWSWLRLGDGVPGGRTLLVVSLAIVPGLARTAWLRALLAVAAAAAALEVAFAAPWRHPERAFTEFGHGIAEFYAVRVPFEAAAHPAMAGVTLAAVFGFAAGTALAIAARRPVTAALAVVAGAAWPATILPGTHPLAVGAVILGSALALLACLPPRALRRTPYAVAASGLLVACALAVSASPSVAKGEFLEGWRTWDPARAVHPRVDVSYVWESDYSGIAFPPEATTVFEVKGPSRSLYWRATALDGVRGGFWEEDHVYTSYTDAPLVDVARAAYFPRAARKRSRWIPQEIHIRRLFDEHLIGASVPVAFRPGKLGAIAYSRSAVAVAGRPIPSDASYKVWSYAPSPTPAELRRSRPLYPVGIRRLDLRVDREVTVPAFGVPGRPARMERFFRAHAEDWRVKPFNRLYRRAVAVAGRSRNPYQAVVALESWFRTEGGFRYDQHPPRAVDVPPLVAFLDTKRGYCQHFAGAMALMLRYLGIPARVAAGFTSGRYDREKKTWTVTDHNAHAWVEVWFRGYGWLPFDPTPGRGALSGTYTASSTSFDPSGAAALLAGTFGVASRVMRLRLERHSRRQNRYALFQSERAVGAGSSAPAPKENRQPGLLALLALVVAGAAAGIGVLKWALRRSRYLSRDPRRIAAACRRELEDFVRDQGLDVPESATPFELVSIVRSAFGAGTPAFARALDAARFGPPAGARAAAREARRELRALRRSLRGELPVYRRARGLVSLRSLTA